MTTQTVHDFIQTRLDEVSTAPSDALAEGGSWPPTTKPTYVAGWRNFTAWCLEHRRAALGREDDEPAPYVIYLGIVLVD